MSRGKTTLFQLGVVGRKRRRKPRAGRMRLKRWKAFSGHCKNRFRIRLNFGGRSNDKFLAKRSMGFPFEKVAGHHPCQHTISHLRLLAPRVVPYAQHSFACRRVAPLFRWRWKVQKCARVVRTSVQGKSLAATPEEYFEGCSVQGMSPNCKVLVDFCKRTHTQSPYGDA